MIITNKTIIIVCNNEKELMHKVKCLDVFQYPNFEVGKRFRRDYFTYFKYENE